VLLLIYVVKNIPKRGMVLETATLRVPIAGCAPPTDCCMESKYQINSNKSNER
jgi:hypothetical protein